MGVDETGVTEPGVNPLLWFILSNDIFNFYTFSVQRVILQLGENVFVTFFSAVMELEVPKLATRSHASMAARQNLSPCRARVTRTMPILTCFQKCAGTAQHQLGTISDTV